MFENSQYNYYEILELSPNAAQHEITTAYERARKTYSGDNPAIYTIFSDKEARELLKLIEESYSILGNKTLRTIYDQRLLGKARDPQDLTYDSILTASRQNFPEPKKIEEGPSHKIDEAYESSCRSKSDWTGQDLKSYREYKGLSLEKISEKTKVNAFYVQAVESMDPQSLPAQVFVRGYVVQLSKCLGLNDKIVADSYMKTFKQKVS